MGSEFQKFLDENLPKVKLNETPETFKVTIEEHYVQTFEIQANDIGEAMEIAEHRYKSGELEVESDEPQATLMMAEAAIGPDCTEWVEF